MSYLNEADFVVSNSFCPMLLYCIWVILLFAEQFNLYIRIFSKLIWSSLDQLLKRTALITSLLSACVNDMFFCKRLLSMVSLCSNFSLKTKLTVLSKNQPSAPLWYISHCRNGMDIILLAPLLEEQLPARAHVLPLNRILAAVIPLDMPSWRHSIVFIQPLSSLLTHAMITYLDDKNQQL